MTTQTTPRLGLTTWTSDSDVPNGPVQMGGNNRQLDNVLATGYADTLANIVNYQGFPGVRFFATDTKQLFRHNGATWVPVLTSVDQPVLSTDLPTPSQDGLYYYATDTNTPYRDNGTQLIALVTQIPASFPVGTIAFVPVNGNSCSATFYVQSASAPSLGTGWAYCDGSALSTTTYPALFSLLGYSYSFTGYTLTCESQNYSFTGATLPTLTGVKNAISSLGITPTVDTYNPNLVVAPAWTLAPSGTLSSGSTFNLPYGIARPMYQYSQDPNENNFPGVTGAQYGLPGPLGWPISNSLEPPPANPWLTDGCPTGCYAVIIKIT